MNNVAVIIPYYTNNLDIGERISLENNLRVLKNRDIFWAIPNGLEKVVYSVNYDKIVRFCDDFFNGREGYNKLMMSPEFYNNFIEYEYILICQTDVFVFEDQLDYFCDMGYDYIGAPWLKGIKSYEGNGYEVCYVGNGGLSLRKTQSMINLFTERQPDRFFWEDYFIASNKDILKLPSVENALEFSFEGEIKQCFKINGKRPMGIHGWWRFDFDAVKEEIQNCGYDLSGIEDEKFDEKPFILDYRKLDDNNENINKHLLKCIPQMSDDVILWGAGYCGDIIGWILKKAGFDNFVYIDKSPDNIGGSLYGNPIKSPECITYSMINNCTWVICSEKYTKEIMDELTSLGVTRDNIILYTEIMNCFDMNKKATYDN